MNIKDLEIKVTNQVIASLEAGVPPWHQQWVKDGSTNALLMSHHNGETGHTYTGINWLITQFSEYSSNDWYTKKGAIKATGLDKPIPYEEFKNGTTIVFFQPPSRKSTLNLNTLDLDEKEQFLIRKTYTIWARQRLLFTPMSTMQRWVRKQFGPVAEREFGYPIHPSGIKVADPSGYGKTGLSDILIKKFGRRTPVGAGPKYKPFNIRRQERDLENFLRQPTGKKEK